MYAGAGKGGGSGSGSGRKLGKGRKKESVPSGGASGYACVSRSADDGDTFNSKFRSTDLSHSNFSFCVYAIWSTAASKGCIIECPN